MGTTVLGAASPLKVRPRTVPAVVAGRVITGIALAFMTLDVSMKLFQVKEAIDGTTQLGFPARVVLPLGLIQLLCLVLYVLPRTAPLGATLNFTRFSGHGV